MANIAQIRFPLSFLRILPKHPEPAQTLLLWNYVNMARDQWRQQVTAWVALEPGQDGTQLSESAFQYAGTQLSKLDLSEIALFVRDGDLPYYFDSIEGAAASVFKGMALHWTDGKRDTVTPAEWKRDCKRVDQLRAGIASDLKKDAWVAIHREIVWDLNKGKWSWEEFALYCAIASKIGRKSAPCIIRYDELIARSSGYKSYKTMPPDAKPLLTIDQIRYRIAKFEGRGLLSTFSKRHGRDRWYWISSRVPDAELKIARHLAKRANAQDRNAQRDRMESLTASYRSKPPQRPPYNPPAPDGPDDGGPPKGSPPPAPIDPPRLEAPKVNREGILSAEGHQWYTRKHLEASLSDAPELLLKIVEEFDQREFDGVTFYSVNRRLAPA